MNIVIPDSPKPSNAYLNRIQVVQGDLVAQSVDAIVTLLPHTLEYRGGLNTTIRDAAGQELESFVKSNVYRAQPGDIYAIPGFDLPAKHIFFCIVPLWKNDFDRHDRDLINAARKSIEQARAMSLKSIAFAPMGAGRSGFPKKRAARLILQGIGDRLDKHLDEVRVVCRTKKTLNVFTERLDLMRF